MGDRALFVFLDPFGTTGYELDLLRPLIERIKDGHSTEMLINFSVPEFHMKSARDTVIDGGGIEALSANNLSRIEGIDRTLGGDWWREFQYDPDLDTAERSRLFVEGYVARLKKAGFEYVGHCPIQGRDDEPIKYELIHGSRHPHAIELMNETMAGVIEDELHARHVEEDLPLFGGEAGSDEFKAWERRRTRTIPELESLVSRYVREWPGKKRLNLWPYVVADHFLRFRRAEYRTAVDRLVASGALRAVREDGKPSMVNGKPRLNDKTRLYPPE